MPNHSNHDRLSLTDSVFLYLEREGLPLHIAGVSLLEGIVPFEDCLRFVESKLPQIPRYRQRVVAPLFNIGRPVWEFDPDFDVRNHLHEVSLRRGTESEFKELSGKILSKLMDRRRPLWDITLVRGLKGDRTGLITRVHHCLADGVSGVDLMNVILGAKPTPPPPARKARRFAVPPQRDPWTAVLDDWMNSYTTVIDQALSIQADVLKFAERLLSGRSVAQAGGQSDFLLELAAPTERLHFNATVQGPQKVAWVQVPLADIKAVKETCGCSVNDVALTLVTSAIRRYAELHGDELRKRLLRIMVPVNLRDENGQGELGNQISIIPVTIPLDIEHPGKLLAAVHERTQFLKKAHVAELATLAGGLIGMVPSAVQAFVGPIATYLPITPFNLVCTNVPGPQFPLYLMEHKMLTWYPYVPIGGDMALNVAVLSYNGTMFFGYSGDANTVPDLARLEKFTAAGMRELQSAFKLRARKKAAIAKARPAAAIDVSPARISAPVVTVPAPSPEPKPVTEEKKVAAAVA